MLFGDQMISIRIMDGPEGISGFDQKPHTFAGGELVIGRGRDVDLLLPDSSRVISRRHASISMEQGSYFLRDTSANGTTINAKLVGQDDEPVLLADGDELIIGAYRLGLAIVTDTQVSTQKIVPTDEFDLSDLIGRAAPKHTTRQADASKADVEDILNNFVGPKKKT